jgi:hypothetical protein
MNVAYGWAGFKSASELYTLLSCYVLEASGSCHTKVTLEQQFGRKSFISHDVSTCLYFFFLYGALGAGKGKEVHFCTGHY